MSKLEPKRIRPFVKWAGGKYNLLDRLLPSLPEGKSLVEPFVGSGAVFLNSEYKKYSLNDSNQDLINLYTILQKEGEKFIQYCKEFFSPKNNTEESYYRLRETYNKSGSSRLRSALFLYLNRHGYNGLCRYSKGKREFNVPYGRYKKPYFPEEEMQIFYEKSQLAIFTCVDFSEVMQKVRKGSIVYCDPPYIPLSDTANFTQYNSKNFLTDEQRQLGKMAEKLQSKGIKVIISNHDTPFTREIYNKAKLESFFVRRLISCQAENRNNVKELLAIY